MNPKKVYTVDKLPESVKESDDRVSTSEEKIYYAFYGGNETNVLEAVLGGVLVKVLIDSGCYFCLFLV